MVDFHSTPEQPRVRGRRILRDRSPDRPMASVDSMIACVNACWIDGWNRTKGRLPRPGRLASPLAKTVITGAVAVFAFITPVQPAQAEGPLDRLYIVGLGGHSRVQSCVRPVDLALLGRWP